MMTPSLWDTIRYFSPSEFDSPESMSYQLLVRLDSARAFAGIPFKLTSTHRPHDSTSSHSEGLAVDIAASTGDDRFRIVNALLAAGFSRIGVYDLHVHVDVAKDRPSPVLWVGHSR
jgi:hypothetical protein